MESMVIAGSDKYQAQLWTNYRNQCRNFTYFFLAYNMHMFIWVDELLPPLLSPIPSFPLSLSFPPVLFYTSLLVSGSTIQSLGKRRFIGSVTKFEAAMNIIFGIVPPYFGERVRSSLLWRREATGWLDLFCCCRGVHIHMKWVVIVEVVKGVDCAS